jgi:hypothetical protein
MMMKPDLPPRVAARPDPAQWRLDEFLTLAEAAILFWPDGPIKTASLRTAQRDGQLAVARVAGKVLTTRGAVEDMIRGALLAAPRAPRRKAERRAPPAKHPDEELRAKIEALVSPARTNRTSPDNGTTE